MNLEPNWRPTQYRGTLTAAQVACGINACFRSAYRLFQDACLLREQGRFPSATALAILAIEEAGKAAILRQIACTSDTARLKILWREFRTHRAKNVMWPLSLSVKAGARTLNDFRELHDPMSDHPELLDSTKQLSLYAECFNNAHWCEPDSVIDAEACKVVMECAKPLCRQRHVTESEILLWIEHVGDLGSKSDLEARAAVAAWHRAMQLLGLSPSGRITMREFVGLPPDAST